MVLAFALSALLIWSYFRDRNFFIAILSAIMFCYSIGVVIITAIKRDNFSKLIFEFLLGSSAVVCLIMIILIIIFSVKASSADVQRKLNTASSPGYNRSYDPPSGNYDSTDNL
jgi:hypothetical protein